MPKRLWRKKVSNEKVNITLTDNMPHFVARFSEGTMVVKSRSHACKMASGHRNAFYILHCWPLWRESTGHRRLPQTNGSVMQRCDAEWDVGKTVELPQIWDAITHVTSLGEWSNLQSNRWRYITLMNLVAEVVSLIRSSGMQFSSPDITLLSYL